MERILVLTDFSPFAEFATRIAIRLAKVMDANLLFTHVLEGSVDWDGLTPGKKELYPKLQEKICEREEKLIKETKKARAQGVIADHEIFVSDHFIDFRNFIRDNLIDLIVIGSHGEKGLTETALGHHSQKTIRNAPCPVLVVPEIPDNYEINKVVFVSNFHDNAKKAFKVAVKICSLLGKKMELLFINTPIAFEDTMTSLRRIEKFRKKNEKFIDGEAIFNHFSEEEGIISYIREAGVDLVIMPTHGRKGFLNFISGSLTETVISHTPVPVLSYKLAE